MNRYTRQSDESNKGGRRHEEDIGNCIAFLLHISVGMGPLRYVIPFCIECSAYKFRGELSTWVQLSFTTSLIKWENDSISTWYELLCLISFGTDCNLSNEKSFHWLNSRYTYKTLFTKYVVGYHYSLKKILKCI